MALSDRIVLTHNPVNYNSLGSGIEQHLSGIDTKLGILIAGGSGPGLTGRPGDNLDASPTLAAMAALSIPTPLAYWTHNFEEREEISPSDPTWIMQYPPSGGGGEWTLPYVVRNANSTLSKPLGALFTHGERLFGLVNTNHASLAIQGDMTYLSMAAYWIRDNADEHRLLDYEGFYKPYAYYIGEHPGVTGAERKDRTLIYLHTNAGGSDIKSVCDFNPSAQSGNGMAISIPQGTEFGHGFRRTVGATTDVEFFLNGLKCGEVTGIDNPGGAASGKIHVGGEEGSSEPWRGSLRCTTIWDSVLTDEEINNFYELCVGKQ